MKALVIAASAIALATPAVAQMQPADPATPSNTTTQSSTTTQTVPADTAVPVGSSTSTDTASTTSATPSDPKALIASEFPTYDKDGNGTLDKAEFGAWMGALKAKTETTPTPAAELAKWTDGAFTTADKDKSKTITLAELQTYLTAGA